MMKKENLKKNQRKLEWLTGRWWFILVFVLLGFILPPYASKGYEFSEMGNVIQDILGNSLFHDVSSLYPIFKILPVLLIISIFFFRNRVTRLFSIYVGITYILFAFLQGIGITNEYGLGIVTGNVVMLLIVAAFWFWEAKMGKNDFTPKKFSIWNYWALPLAFLAFWFPLNLETMKPDFNPIYLFTNPAGLAFCMMTPVYLAILILYYPKVNIPTLRITALSGIIIGFWNMVVNFLIKPDILWWNGVLHLPLVFISIYALILSFRKPQLVETTKEIK